MPTWRCPHCGTPQTETARCWVCRRSSTACDTCRHFRRSIAGTLGYCGLDRRRAPLRGDEIRACWEPRPVVAAADAGRDATRGAPPVGTMSSPLAVASTSRRDFVEVDGPGMTAGRPVGDAGGGSQPGAAGGGSGPRESTDVTTARPAKPISPHLPAPPAEPRWNLWGDLEA